ncbi:hypothetical protein CJ177_09095 [Rhodococcus sp. ACPA1]|nr:hypothetical protein CJ177_09095 [Rhodococcus sp. ACPA1]
MTVRAILLPSIVVSVIALAVASLFVGGYDITWRVLIEDCSAYVDRGALSVDGVDTNRCVEDVAEDVLLHHLVRGPTDYLLRRRSHHHLP